MRVTEFLPDAQRVLAQREGPAYRLKQVYGAPTVSLVRDWEEAKNLPKELRSALAGLLDHPLYHLNLLRLAWTDTGFAATSRPEARDFLRRATELGLSATPRPSRGEGIDAACGQRSRCLRA